jgi:putative transposase
MGSEIGPHSELSFPKFQRGRTTLELKGRLHAIVGLTKDKRLLVQDEETGEPDTLSSERFWQLYEADELAIDDHVFDHLPERFKSALDSVEPTIDRDGWAAFRRFKYIVAADRAGASKTEGGLKPIIEQVSLAIKDIAPPDHRTLATWMRERGVPGHRFARLMIDRHDQKGRTDWLGEEENIITEQTIETYYKNKRQLRPSEIIEAVGGEIAKRNVTLRTTLGIDTAAYKSMEKAERKRLGFLIEPHSTTIGRRIARHEGYETKKLREGKKAANAEFVAVRKPPPIARYANHVWYIDHTRLDGHLAYNAKTKLPLGRPWLTTVVDAYSRLIVGFFISFIPPSIHSVSMALKNAISSKNYVRQKFPSIGRPWLAFGLPEVVVCDRALEFTGFSFELACADLSIEVVWCPRKTPQWKGIIERTNRTINTNFVELLPGSTKGDPRKLTKQERDPSKEAEIPYDQLDRDFHKWVIEVYPRKTHTGLGDRPGDVYGRSIHENHPRVPTKAADLAVLGMSFRRTLTRKGIHFLFLRYSDPEKVSAILRRAKKAKVRVLFTVDAGNLGEIVVRDPTTGERVVLRCLDQERANGTSLWEHRNALKWMRMKLYDPADRESWLIAKKEIRDSMMARLLNARAKLTDRTRAAREAKIGENALTNPTILNELYGDEADMEWLKQEFVEAERTDPEDADELANTDAHNGGATPEKHATSGMSQFGRIHRKRKPKSSQSSGSQVHRTATAASNHASMKEEVVQIYDTVAVEEHREQMAAFKRPNFNRKAN